MQNELFVSKNHEPLAFRMRPDNLNDYQGQSHILEKGKLLRRAIEADMLSSIILYGPPGTGKTTLAKIIAKHNKDNHLYKYAIN
jgi:putative ATPase